MKHLKILLVTLLIISMVSGDKLFLSTGQVHEGKYIGIVEGEPTFLYSNENRPTIINPKEIIAITDNFGNVIITKEELLNQVSKIKKKHRRIIMIAAGGTILCMAVFLLWWQGREGQFSYTTID